MTLHVRAVYGPHFSCPKGWLAVFAEVELLAVLVVMTEGAREQESKMEIRNSSTSISHVLHVLHVLPIAVSRR